MTMQSFDSKISHIMFLHDYLLDCEISTVRTLALQLICVYQYLMPGLHLQRNSRKSAIQKIYDGPGNFNDGCVASGARLLQRLRCSTLTSTSTTVVKLPRPSLIFSLTHILSSLSRAPLATQQS